MPWGKPSFAKKWHCFTEKGSLCGDYNENEIPNELLTIPPYHKICDRCLLEYAKMNLPKLLEPEPEPRRSVWQRIWGKQTVFNP